MALNNKKKKAKRSRVKNQAKNNNPPSILPQLDSPLLRLPGELRRHIYDFLFLNKVTFGKRYTAQMESKTMKIAPHFLALLRVCRQIYKEVRSFWLSQSIKGQ